ncbi:helicase-associated domain-containing protein [Corynebacterium tapiri]|uniref:Helicase XPB/Ssl2 N-terminal domain-containing protein n=1 Tax=Corynebacterium tapiri TaxID=1448266 RepID=A0A5C4U661_9CORY|nr:helicase-associated domain-containing protein [Corynebacterium tapiri]TNM00382.1 hypothetical protein FHE74_00045 [Corynebacterium tapiri]
MDNHSFRTWLSQRTDDQLTQLLRLRPDVAHPLPPTMAALATRLRVHASLARAAAELSALQLAVLEAASAAGAEFEAVSVTAIVEVLTPYGASPESIECALEELEDRALLIQEDASVLLTEVLSTLPPSFHVVGTQDLSWVRAALEELDPKQHSLLNALARADGIGHSKDAALDADPTRPIPRLIEAGLLERADGSHVRLTAAVAAVLRGQPPIPLTPVQPHPSEDAQRLNSTGAAQGLEFCRLVADLIAQLSQQPVALNKDGRLGARSCAGLAKTLADPSATETNIACAITVAASAGLIGTGLTSHVPDPLPSEANYLAATRGADEWLELSAAERYSALIDAWLASPWATWESNRPLETETRHSDLPRHKRLVLAGYPLHTPISTEDARIRALSIRPVLGLNLAPERISGVAEEARLLGLLVPSAQEDAATSIASQAAQNEDFEATLLEIVPAEVDQFIVQGDLTLLVPGPPTPELARELNVCAQVDTPGLASTYRFTEATVRRAFDAGRSESELHEWLAGHSMSELPQALMFLISDVARRHGALRGGAIASYLRCADPEILSALMASPQAAQARLRLIADTVAVSELPLAQVVSLAQQAGFHPAAEDSSGATIDLRPEPARLFAQPQVAKGRREAPEPEVLTRAVAAMRERDNPAPEESGADVTALLTAAVRGGRSVSVTAVNAQGAEITSQVTPVSVAGGRVDARNLATGATVRIPLSRIKNVRMN